MANKHIIARQAPTLAPSPSLEFTSWEPASPTSCAQFGISWFYNGPSQPLDIYITNFNIPQDPPPSASSSSTPNTFTNDGDRRRAVPTGAQNPDPAPSLISTLITTIQNPFDLGYGTQALAVPPGWYALNGSIPSLSFSKRSAQTFYVWPGTDTSCLAVSLPNSSSSTPTGTPTSASNSDPSSSSSPSSLPVGASSSTNIGTIIGVSVAAVIVVAGVLAAWLCLSKRRRAARGLSGDGYVNDSGRGGGDHRWNGLSSTDSRNVLTGGGKNYPSKSKSSKKNHGQQQRMPQSRDSFGSAMMTDEGGDGMEKTSFDAHGMVLAALPVLNHNQNHTQVHTQNQNHRQRTRTYSQSSATSNGYSVTYHNNEGGGPTRRSSDNYNYNYPPQSPSAGAAYAAYSTQPPSHHSSVRSPQLKANNSQGSSQNHSLSSPVSPSSSDVAVTPSSYNSPSDTTRSAKQSNRQSLGGKKRKPVPAYNPNEEATPSPSPVTPQEAYNYTSNPFSPSSSPNPASVLDKSESPIPGTTTPPQHQAGNNTPPQAQLGHYTTRNQSQHSLHQLQHKSSFGAGGLIDGVGGKPVHYLIPDMPMGA